MNFKNFVEIDISTGYDAVATAITLSAGEVASLPNITDGVFNLVWYNATDYASPHLDPNREIVKVINIVGDVLTIVRPSGANEYVGEGSDNIAKTHNIAGKQYKFLLAVTKSVASQIQLKQVIFSGVCQEQYLTENDVSIDCTGVLARYAINTVKNGEPISITNPLCFYTDGNGVSTRHIFTTPIYVDFAYTVGIWYIHINTSGVLVATQTPWTEFGTNAVLHRVYIDPSLAGDARNVTEIVEYHKNDISGADHLWKHVNNGTIHLSGLEIVNNVLTHSSGVPTIAPNVDGRNTVISITSGSTVDENLQANILNSLVPARFSQDLGNISAGALTLSNSALFKISYNDAGGVLKMLPATRFPFAWDPATNRPQFISNTGVRTIVADNRWMVNFVYSFADPRYGECVKVRSALTDFASFTDAQAFSWEALQAASPTLRDPEIRPLYKIIHYVNYVVPGVYDVAVKYAGLVEVVDIRKLQVKQSSAVSGTVLATSVSFAPYGNISATNVQSALEELDNEKEGLITEGTGTLLNGQTTVNITDANVIATSFVDVYFDDPTLVKGSITVTTAAGSFSVTSTVAQTANRAFRYTNLIK